MKVIRTINELKHELQSRRNKGHSIGFVPTMGYLHEGHLSLVHAAASQNEVVVLSIFVNPLQFGPNEDFERYPRDEERDLRLAEMSGVDIAFLPTVNEMYPTYPLLTKVTVANITMELCGASRPGHFDGVSTVVMKLFNIVEPDRAYFGLKDAQQVAVVQQMVNDLNMNVEVVPCPIVREPDGLAKSSRNVYLSPKERKQAVVLHEALVKLDEWLKDEQMTITRLRENIIKYIETASLAEIEYVDILAYPTLTPYTGENQFIVALAVKFGSTRLIDNRIIHKAEVNVHV